MALFDWKPIYSVGIPSIDGQHQKLIGYMNEFHEAQLAFKTREAHSALLNLLRFTKVHFQNEENLMERVHYPEFEAHKVAHQQLLTVAEKLAKTYEADSTPKNAENMGNYLKTWLANHILGIDKKYSHQMIDKGIQ